MRRSPSRPATTAGPTTTTVVEAASAAWTTDAILPVVAGLFPENDTWNIVEVDIADRYELSGSCSLGHRFVNTDDESVVIDHEESSFTSTGGTRCRHCN